MDDGLIIFLLVMMLAMFFLVIYGALTAPKEEAEQVRCMELTEGEVEAVALYWSMVGGKYDVCSRFCGFSGCGGDAVGSGDADRDVDDVEGFAV